MTLITITVHDLQYRAEYDGTNVIYEGWSLPGIADDVAKWKICKHTYDGYNLTATNWASDSKDYAFKWSTRGAYFP